MKVNLFTIYAENPKYKRQFKIASFYSFLNKFFDLFPPILIGLAVDTVVKKTDSFLAQIGFPNLYHQLILLGLFTIFIWVLESIFEFLFKKEWKGLAQDIQHQLRGKTYHHIQNLDQKTLESERSGNLLSIVNDDINQLERFLDFGINQLIQLATTIICIGIYFLYISPEIALTGFLVIPLIVLGSIWYQKFLATKYKKVRETVGILNSELNNNLQGLSTIKAFTNEEKESKRINSLSQSYVESNKEAIFYSALFTPSIRMLIMGAFIVTLIYGGHLTIQGKLEVGSYSVLIFLIQRLLWPLTSLGDTLDLYQRSMASYIRILELLRTKINIKNGHQSLVLTNPPRIEFCDVDFSYDSKIKILNNISLIIKPNTKIAFVGSTGSGKSTITKLLLRFYDTDKGNIYLNNNNIKDIKISNLRKLISLVSQDAYLFHGTVYENLIYGNANIDQVEVEEICKLCCIHRDIISLPEKYNTIVGERGQKLSGGQKQRVSIARALIADRPIIILDEATSAIDNVTESILQSNLNKYLKEKTVISIAHRLSTITNSDQILVMEDGQIIERGNHSELLSKQGYYMKLWNKQVE